MRCSKCDTENPERSRFCQECGTAVAAPRAAAPRAERRQITVLFCDLVGSTKLSEQLDPEDLRDVIQAYQRACSDVVRGFDGHIAQYLGDGVLVYFGYPEAHEDDALRAVRAGLEIVSAVGEVRSGGRPLQVRVGIHTGLVVVGEVGVDGQTVQLALGETPNLAARVQQEAAPDTVVVSEATHRLVRGYFTNVTLGERTLKGASLPTRLFRMDGESGARGRIAAAAAAGLSPFVGREQELGTLVDAWEGTQQGRGRVVAIRGEPGIGKSRLLETLKSRLDPSRHIVAECQCTPYHENSVLFPFIDLLERRLDLKGAATADEKLARLERALDRSGPYPAHTAPLLAGLLSIPTGVRYAPLEGTPLRQRQLSLEALRDWLLRLAAQRPVVFILEDLHWADPTTLELVKLIVGRRPDDRLLCVLTYRPEFRPSWSRSEHLTEVELRPLPAGDSITLVGHVAERKRLPADVVDQIVARTGGIPLFVEEVTKAVLETGLLIERDDHYELTGPLPPGLIPATVQDSLAARIDRLGPSKPLAQLAATMGREFRYDVLRAVSDADDESMQKDLRRLIESELVIQEGRPPAATYTFRHALIRDAAYGSLLRKTRQQYHEAIARALRAQLPEIAETQPEVIATHYEAAGLAPEALDEWQRAVDRAKARAATSETIAHIRRALALLNTVPPGPDRLPRDLTLQLALGPALMAMKGFSAPEVREVYTRARALCREMGDPAEVFPVLWGLWAYYFVAGDFGPAVELGDEVFRMAKDRGAGPDLLIPALHAIGYSTMYGRADYRRTRELAESGIALFDEQRERTLVRHYQMSCSSALLDMAGTAVWALGYPDQAARLGERAFAVARSLDHHPTLAWGTSCCTWGVPRLLGQAGKVEEAAETAIRLSSQEDFSFWPPLVRVFRGWSWVEQGKVAEGIAETREALTSYRAIGGGVLCTSGFALLAQGLLRAGRHKEGLAAIAQGFEHVRVSGERHYSQELHRIKGELLLATSRDPGDGVLDEAEGCFRCALDQCRAQGAKSFELRAAMSLAYLWSWRGKRREALGLLSETYGWFTEGFETPDLQQARALIVRLSA
jgi:class 3 adenylate cyclase/tetratricopeptide (TPR) repeat protein